MNKCIICEKNLGNTYSLKIKKDNTYFHTCSYNCNCKVEEKLGDDYWFYVTNKTDFIKYNSWNTKIRSMIFLGNFSFIFISKIYSFS